MSKFKAIYISGPYSKCPNTGLDTPVARQRNIHRAWAVTAQMWEIPGVYPVCPHLNSMNMDGQDTYENFLGADLDLLARCDAILMMVGWEKSAGARRERERAAQLGLPIFYQDWDASARIEAWRDGQDWEAVTIHMQMAPSRNSGGGFIPAAEVVEDTLPAPVHHRDNNIWPLTEDVAVS